MAKAGWGRKRDLLIIRSDTGAELSLRSWSYTSCRTLACFQCNELNLTSTWDVGSQHCLSGKKIQNSQRFSSDLDHVKWRQPGAGSAILAFQGRLCYVFQNCWTLLSLSLPSFPMYSAQPLFAEQVSLPLFISDFLNKLCHCLLLTSWNSVLQGRRTSKLVLQV